MKKKDTQSVFNFNFKEQTPEMFIGVKKQDPLYEKAFLSREDMSKTEFAQNTTAWD